MVNKNNKTCIICKSGYSYCPNCKQDGGKPSWYAIFDGQNCFDIYEICTGYRDKILTIEDAKSKLAKCDLSKLENFAETTKNQINEIMSYKNEKLSNKEVEQKVEVNNVDNEKDAKTEKFVNSKKSVFAKR